MPANVIKLSLVFVVIVFLLFGSICGILVAKYLIEEVSLLMDVIHEQLLFLLRIIHERKGLNYFEKETLVYQELLTLVCVIHLLGVS